MSAPRACGTFEVVVTPPAYTGRPVETARNPSQLTVIEGSRLRVTATADAASVTLETASGAVAITTTAAGTFVGEIASRDRRFPGDATRRARRPQRRARSSSA